MERTPVDTAQATGTSAASPPGAKWDSAVARLDAVDPDLAPGVLLGGRYRLRARLGAGGFAQVYHAFDEALAREVAVKVLTLRSQWAPDERRERRARFRQEAVAAAALNHPNVATVHDAGDHEGRPFIVMELLRGTDLGQVLLARGGLPVAEVIAYGAQVCDGLQHAHAHGLVHRDIKPENLMLLPDGTVKICDFGLVAHSDGDRTVRARSRAVLGSPGYLSPEQVTGGTVTGRSDLYAAGCVLYALLTEGPPFTGAPTNAPARAHLHDAPEPLRSRRRDVPAALARLVHRMLAKDPADRPGSAGEVAALLRAMLAQPTTTPMAVRDGSSGTNARHRVWTLLEEGEALLRTGDFAAADLRYQQASQRLDRLGAQAGPESVAARFGRIRALEGLGGTTAAARRLTGLAAEASAALGPCHPLARCIASYAADHPERRI